MSVLKYINRKNWGKQNLKRIINYILQEEKTNSNLICSNGVSIENADEDILTMQRLVGKDTKRQYIHFVISFDREVDAESGFKIAKECAAYYKNNYPYIMSVHTDTKNIHAHVILSTVNVRTALKFSQSKKDMLNYREYVNNILKSYGLETVGDDEFEENDSFDDFIINDERTDDNMEEFQNDFPGFSESLTKTHRRQSGYEYQNFSERHTICSSETTHWSEEEERPELEKSQVKITDSQLEAFMNILLKAASRLGIKLEEINVLKGMNDRNCYRLSCDDTFQEDIESEDYEENAQESWDEFTADLHDEPDNQNHLINPMQYGSQEPLISPMQYGSQKPLISPMQYGSQEPLISPMQYGSQESLIKPIQYSNPDQLIRPIKYTNKWDEGNTNDE